MGQEGLLKRVGQNDTRIQLGAGVIVIVDTYHRLSRVISLCAIQKQGVHIFSILLSNDWLSWHLAFNRRLGADSTLSTKGTFLFENSAKRANMINQLENLKHLVLRRWLHKIKYTARHSLKI
jgi:hypothetical protein